MNIYLLKRRSWTEYDNHVGFTVAALSTTEARRYAYDASEYDLNGRDVWLGPEDTSCARIGTAMPAVKAGILLASFRAG